MKPFPWRAGMRALDSRGHAWRLFDGSDGVLRAQGEPDGYCGGWLSTAPLLEAKPDPNNGATKGGFLEAVREKYGDPEAHLIRLRTHDLDPENPMGDAIPVLWWALADRCGHLIVSKTPDGFPKRLAGPTEFAALEAAWEAAP